MNRNCLIVNVFPNSHVFEVVVGVLQPPETLLSLG